MNNIAWSSRPYLFTINEA